MVNLGETIKQERKRKKFSQPQLAKLLDVSNGIISQWENNVVEPKATYIKRLAIVFEVSCDYLLGLENEDGTKRYNIQFRDNNGNINFY